MRSHYYTKGFTLIEVLVVISIIGIMASVILTNLNSARGNAYNAERLSSLRNFTNAIELYYSDHLVYPPDGDPDWRLTTLTDDLATNNVSTFPIDPEFGDTNNGYHYCVSGDQKSYTILVPSDKGRDAWCALKHTANIPDTQCWFTAGVPDNGWCDDEIK